MKTAEILYRGGLFPLLHDLILALRVNKMLYALLLAYTLNELGLPIPNAENNPVCLLFCMPSCFK